MSLKARLRIAIISLVTLVVIAMALMYLYDFTKLTFSLAASRAGLIADQVKGNLVDRLDRETSTRGLHPASLEEWKNIWTGMIRSDPRITDMLRRVWTNAEFVGTIQVTDEQGKVLAASDPAAVNTTPARAREFHELQTGNWVSNLWGLWNRREDYTTIRPLGVEESRQVLFKVMVVVPSALVKHSVEPALKNLALAFGASLFIAIFLGSVLPGVVLDPLERVSQKIDLIRAGQFDTATHRIHQESREFAAVQSKLSLLSEQYQGARQDAVELRRNIDQLLQRLEEAVLLFDNAGKLVIAGETAEHLLGKSHDQMIGRGLEELFPATTVLGEVVGNAVRARQSVHEHAVTIAREGAGKIRLLVSVEVLRRSPGQEEIGTLIKLRDVESRRQLERQLDVASRLAAISRLTGGVAHEIKNPLNAIALHLEVLRGKLDAEQPELEVIAGEIKRLDNVVKTFLNFNKPIELQAQPIDLDQVVEQVLALVSVDAQAKQIQIESDIQAKLNINGDPDLLKQAILNVVNNGMEAMEEGGKLTVCAGWSDDECQVTITDDGPGIPTEVQSRIFNLYFTTKEHGSGIGLATTFRVVQLHSGTIDFVSEQGKGATFRMRFPGVVDYESEALTSATSTS